MSWVKNTMPQTQDMTPHSVTAYRHRANLSLCQHLMLILGREPPLTFTHTSERSTLWYCHGGSQSKARKNVPYLPSLEPGSSGMQIHFRHPLAHCCFSLGGCECVRVWGGGGGQTWWRQISGAALSLSVGRPFQNIWTLIGYCLSCSEMSYQNVSLSVGIFSFFFLFFAIHTTNAVQTSKASDLRRANLDAIGVHIAKY